MNKKDNRIKHGGWGTRLYNIWNGMIGRCERSSNPNYKLYGNRGVIVCKAWKNFEKFKSWALANGYQENLSLDRINNSGNYEPSNCRWVTMKEQENNRGNNRRVIFNGQEKTVSEWAEITGIGVATLFTRFNRGWTAERALSTPVKNRG